ncbi:hypothetical protein DYBT9623_05464 [Dyadobacter sp. CECT 9623]|uniref:BRCT domain-containing protein n=1 Tax=Dyadobacter linearis TaxID=2823330 RepID=A0ABN7RJR1_9BACT|nr:hypothetical protein [Dyadobacter sp. CECT 9623]CAG5074776.1 hypothetical protein DYBT9623_05464 [Dyadobacter sp. CECT 9623]
MATTLPPPRKAKVTEADIEAVINKGGSTIKDTASSDPEKAKHINVRLTGQIISEIDIRRLKRPRRPGSPKPGISIHDWIVEAVLEKLQSEK